MEAAARRDGGPDIGRHAQVRSELTDGEPDPGWVGASPLEAGGVVPYPRSDTTDPATLAGELRNEVPPDRARLLYTFVAVVVLTAVAVVAPSLGDLPGLVRSVDPEFWLIAVLAVAVDARPLRAPGRAPLATVFPSITFTFALLLGWGVAPAVIVQLLAVVVSSIRLKHAPWRALFNASQYAIAFAVCSPTSNAPISPTYSWPLWQQGILQQTNANLGRYTAALSPRQMSMSLRWAV